MKKEIVKRIFEFLEEKGEHNMPFNFKLLNNEPLTKRDLNVEGSLYLATKNIISLPKGLKVGGDLDLSYSKIKSLPKGLEVKGWLSLGVTLIESLPEGLKVGGNIYAYESNLSSLPKGLEVGGDLYLREVDLEKYSDEELREMIKPGFIKGKIDRDYEDDNEDDDN
jgi:hypothetical protein